MAKLDGGVFSRPRGKTGGLVFGAARTRQGKVATVRQLVPPSNPNTAAQQTQRTKFKEALEIVRQIGKSIYGSDWNRAISQLPGFQSMMSIFMNNMDDQYVLTLPAETNLGSLFTPGLGNFVANTATSVIVEGAGLGTGPNGTLADKMVAILIATNPGPSASERVVGVGSGAERSTQEQNVELSDGTVEFLGALYYQGAGTAAGLVSNAEWKIDTPT
jgi:hypothetical protein